MTDDDYFTTDTESVASEIDTAEVRTADDASDANASFNWKRPVGYLLLMLSLVAIVSIGLWLWGESLLIT